MSVEERPSPSDTSPAGGCAAVDPLGGYRWYRESQLATARLVAQLRRLDMPLAQIEQVVSAPGPLAAELIESYCEAVERRIASQRELAAHLRIRLLGGEGSYPMFEIHQREVPEQLVLTEQWHVQAAELPGWLRAAMDRLDKAAQAHGGLAGSWFVVYHGEVDEDSDGPVEVCAPIIRRMRARPTRRCAGSPRTGRPMSDSGKPRSSIRRSSPPTTRWSSGSVRRG